MKTRRTIILLLMLAVLSGSLFAQISRIRNPMTNVGAGDTGDLELYTVVKLIDDMTVAACNELDVPIGVITIVEDVPGAPDLYYVASSDIAKVGIATASSAISVGDRLVPADAGKVQRLDDHEEGYVIGIALDDGVAGDFILMMIGLSVGGGAADQSDFEVPITSPGDFSTITALTDVHAALVDVDGILAGVGSTTLQDAYNVGTTIVTVPASGPVDISSPSANALLVTTNTASTDAPAIKAVNTSTGPAIWSDGDLRIRGTARLFSEDNINLQLDKGGDGTTTNNFIIRDDGDAVVFTVGENSNVAVSSTGDYEIGTGAGAWGLRSVSDALGATDLPISYPDLGAPGYNVLIGTDAVAQAVARLDNALTDPAVITHSLQNAYDDGNSISVTSGAAVTLSRATATDYTILDISGDVQMDGTIAIKDAGGEGYYGTLGSGDISAHRTYTLPDASGEISVLGQSIGDTEIAWGSTAGLVDASDLPYVNTASGLTATDVQAAIDEVEGRVDAVESGSMSVLSSGNGIGSFTYDGSSPASVAVQGGTGVTVDGSGVNVNYGTTAGTAVQGNQTGTITAGGGLTGGISADALGDGFSTTIEVGDGNGITVAADQIDVNVGTGLNIVSDQVRINNAWFSSDISVAADGAVTISNAAVQSDDIDWGTGGSQVDATDVPYTPTTGADWIDPDPTQVGDALDDISGRVASIEGGSTDQTLAEVLTAGNLTGGTAIDDGDGIVDIAQDLRVAGNTIYGQVGGSTNLVIASNHGIRMDLDDDGGGTADFAIRNGGDGLVFTVTEGGNLTADGNAEFDGNLTLSGTAARTFQGPADNPLDIKSDTGLDIYIDADNDVGYTTEFVIKDGLENELFKVEENSDVRFYGRVLDNDGDAGTVVQVLGADGSGNLDWVNASSYFTDTDNQNLSWVITAPPITLDINDGTDVRFAQGDNIQLSAALTDLTISAPSQVDLVAGTGLTGGQDNILLGSVDGDVTIGLANGSAANDALIWNGSTWIYQNTTNWDKDVTDDFTTGDETDPIFTAVNTEAELEAHISDVTNIYTNTDGNLNDDNLADNDLNDLSDVVITSGAQGHLLYSNGTNWVNLGPGTSGQVLSTNGTGANPSWKNDAGATSLNELSDVSLGSLSSGEVLTYNGTNWANGELAASSISSADIANWNTAYGWGNHAAAGYDEFVGNEWTAISDGTTTATSSPALGRNTINFAAAGGAAVTVNATTNTVTINATGSGTDVDNYVEAATFNTGSGVLTLDRTTPMADVTVDLDGRFAIASELSDNNSATTPVDWDDLTDIPSDIADGDANTTYSAGTGLTLAGTTFSHTAHTGDATGSTALTVVRLQGRNVASTAPTNGQVLTWNNGTTQWEPASATTGTVSNIATNNGITGGPITTTGTIGLTGQALALHNLATNGLIVRTGAGTVAARSIAVSGNGIAITNGNGVSDNPTISLNIGTGATQVAAGNHTHTGVYDNYGSWNLQANGGTAVGITSGANVNFTGTGGATITRSGNTINVDASSAGDNWGSQTVVSNARLTGLGTSASPLDIAQNGATSGQVLKWSGSAWAPAADAIDEDEDIEDQLLSINSSAVDDIIYISDGHGSTLNSVTIDDNYEANTDNQALTVGAGTATTSLINLSGSASAVTLQQGTNVTLSEAGNTITINAIADGAGITSVNSQTGPAVTVDGGTALTDVAAGNTITLNHDVVWATTSTSNSSGVVIQNMNFDGLGHVTGTTGYNLDNRYYTEAEIDGFGYVPYTGATNDVDLGTYDLYVDIVHANKVDPTMKIDGQLFVTWMAENIGFWIDMISEAQLTDGEFRVDLAQQPEGSDLWLFWRSVAEGSVIPLVTAQDPAILMARMEGSVLLVRSISGEENARFSFRLSGKRLDEAAKTEQEINRPSEPTDHYIDLDKYDRRGKLK